jgi:hypothetical protein
MGLVELLQHQEKACWDTYVITGKLEDLAVWRKALGQLNDELQHRVRLLTARIEPRRTQEQP